MQSPAAVHEARRKSIELWLLRRGAPHFIEGYSATTNVWTRAFPLVVSCWAVGMVIEVGFAVSTRLLGFAVALGIVMSCWIGSNRIRHRRPLALPDTIGASEVLFFVFSPALVSLLVDRNLWRGVLSALIGTGVIAAIYLSTSYGLVALTRYVFGRFGSQVRLLGNLSSRAIPLLLLITVTIFLTSETWQMSSRLVGASQFATVGLFVVAGSLFLLSRVPGEVAAVQKFDSWVEITEAIRGTPAEWVVCPHHGNPGEPDTTRGQRINLIVMAMTTQAIQITLVASAVSAFFILLGLAAIPPATANAFIGSAPHVLVSVNWGASTFALTEELLRVAGFLGAFSGMAFTVYLVTDSTYRTEFAYDVSEELRRVLAVRIAYLHHLRHKVEPSVG